MLIRMIGNRFAVATEPRLVMMNGRPHLRRQRHPRKPANRLWERVKRLFKNKSGSRRDAR